MKTSEDIVRNMFGDCWCLISVYPVWVWEIVEKEGFKTLQCCEAVWMSWNVVPVGPHTVAIPC